MCWPTWLCRTGRHRSAVAAAAAADADEQTAARQRIIDLARGDRWGRNAPAAVRKPVVTREQTARGHGGYRL